MKNRADGPRKPTGLDYTLICEEPVSDRKAFLVAVGRGRCAGRRRFGATGVSWGFVPGSGEPRRCGDHAVQSLDGKVAEVGGERRILSPVRHGCARTVDGPASICLLTDRSSQRHGQTSMAQTLTGTKFAGKRDTPQWQRTPTPTLRRPTAPTAEAAAPPRPPPQHTNAPTAEAAAPTHITAPNAPPHQHAPPTPRAPPHRCGPARERAIPRARACPKWAKVRVRRRARRWRGGWPARWVACDTARESVS